jgi:N-acetyl-alpha-D-muramate 1-phosphate uridylyltransferase
MSPAIDTAMVLAAGLGTRMRPLTNDRPKALVEVAGKALIDHVLDRLVQAGVTKAVVNVHAFADLLEAHLRRRQDIAITISDERAELLETGGGCRKALPLLGGRAFVVCNIDSVWDEPHGSAIARLIRLYDPARMGVLLMLAAVERSLGFDGAGDFFMDGDGRLTRRGEAPSAPWAYMGAHICDPTLLADEPIEPFSLNRIWSRLIPQGRLYGVALGGFWMHVGDPIAREAAETRLRSRA